MCGLRGLSMSNSPYQSLFSSHFFHDMAVDHSINTVKISKNKHKCYSAKTALKRGISRATSGLIDQYKKCKHCAWYSDVFYNHNYLGVKIIENNEDFEKVKQQFVNHMNRSHPDICEKKIMKRLSHKEKYV